jgi:hypothetical protein
LKVLVIGTSNSLLRDGLAAMAREFFGEGNVDNRSLGNVPGSIYALTHVIDGINFEDYDFILLDLLVNESYMRGKHISGAFVDACAELFYATLPQGMRCLHFFYSHQESFERPDATELLHKDLCAKYGIGVVNVRERLLDRSLRQGLRIGQIFQDHAHFNTALVKNVVHEAFASIDSFRPKYTKTVRHHSLFSIVPQGFPLVSRGNALRTGKYAVLSEGDRLEIPKDCRMLGFFFHQHSTSCFLNVSGSRPLCKSMVFAGGEPYVNFTTWRTAEYRSAKDVLYPTKSRGGVDQIEWTSGSVVSAESSGTLELGSLYLISCELEYLVTEARGVAFR